MKSSHTFPVFTDLTELYLEVKLILQLMQKLKLNLTVWTTAQDEPISDMLLAPQQILLYLHFVTIITPEQKSVGLVFSFCCLFQLCGTWCLVHGTSTTPIVPLSPDSVLLPQRRLVPSCYMYLWWISPEKFLLVMFLDVGEHSSGRLLFWISGTEWICLIVYYKVGLYVYHHCLIMHSLIFKVLFR